MRDEGPLRSRAVRGLTVAVAGLFAGHVLVYRLIAPNALQRAVLLAGTGHGYLPLAIAVGLLLAGVGGGAAFGFGFRRSTSPGPASRRPGLTRALILPAVTQALAFLVLETLERAVAGAPMGSLLGPLLPVGVALQLLVGAAGGLVLFGLDRAGELAGMAVTARRRPRPRHRPMRLRPTAEAAPGFLPATAWSIRGPPQQA